MPYAPVCTVKVYIHTCILFPDHNTSSYSLQSWHNNMSKTTSPKITPFEGTDFTEVTFNPDLSKFKMTELDADTMALLTRRAYDLAGGSKGVKVFLNGKRLPVSMQYIYSYLDNHCPCHEQNSCYKNCLTSSV